MNVNLDDLSLKLLQFQWDRITHNITQYIYNFTIT